VHVGKNKFFGQAQGAVLIDKSNQVTIDSNIWKRDLVKKREVGMDNKIIISNNEGF